MFLRSKKWLVVLLSMLCIFALASGCGSNDSAGGSGNGDAEIPTLNMAWDFDLHASALLAAVAKGEDFADSGYYLKELINKEQY